MKSREYHDRYRFSVAGGNIAAAWAALKVMGKSGYMDMAKKLMDTTVRLKEGINAIPVSNFSVHV